MRRTELAGGIRPFMCAALALLANHSLAAQTLPTPVATITTFPFPASDAYLTNMRFGPDGLIYAWDGQNIWQQSGVNVDGFNSTPFGTVPSAGSDAGPINFSQNGQTILIGNGFGGQDSSGASNGLLYAMPASGGMAKLVGRVPNHFDMVPAPAAMPSANSRFIVDVGTFSGTTFASEVDMFDDTTGKTTPLIQNIPGASASIAFDSANRLYVGIGYGDNRGQIRRFNLPLLNSAAAGQTLDWSSGQLFNSADNNSGEGMFFDAHGNLFTGGPDGVAVFNANGASQIYSTGTASSPVVSYNATNDQFAMYLIGFSDPLMLGYSPLIYNASAFNAGTAPTTNWTAPAGGNWSDGTHWNQATAPNGIDQAALLGNGAAPQTIALDVPVTLGMLTFNNSAKYLMSGPSSLTMQVSTTIAAINVTNGSHEIAAPIVLASDTDVTVTNVADTLTLSGGVSGAAMLSKEGSGTLTITGPTTYTGNTAVDAGKLRFAIATGTATVGSGAVVTVAAGATLELAGPVSALGSAAGKRAHIINDSTAGGLIVSADNQVVGGIDGAGQTTVAAGSSLTADHIVQSALIIGGSSTQAALVTIAPSSNSVVASTGLIDSLASGAPFGSGIDTFSALGSTPDIATADMSTASYQFGGGALTPVVPEPSPLAIGLIAAATLAVRLRQSTAARRRDASLQFAAAPRQE